MVYKNYLIYVWYSDDDSCYCLEISDRRGSTVLDANNLPDFETSNQARDFGKKWIDKRYKE